jgi:group I intron endonuclease
MKGIYIITNKVNNKKYIGLSNDINRRFWEHKSSKKKKNNTNLIKAFKKYHVDNFDFQILELVDDESKLAEREMFWIESIKPEYNMNKGGNGNLGHTVSNEVREVLRICGKLQWERKTDEEKQRIIKNNLTGTTKGRIVSEETRRKLREYNLGRKHTEEAKLKVSIKNKGKRLGNTDGNKKVIKLDINGNFISEHNSIKEAAIELGIHPSNITKVLKGEQITAGGYKWNYKQ